MLTDFKIRQAKATGKNYSLSDSDGLYLFVSNGGSKRWHFRYTWLGERTRTSLVSYPELSLKDARELRKQARAMVAKHINPRIERKQKLNAIKIEGEDTFITDACRTFGCSPLAPHCQWCRRASRPRECTSVLSRGRYMETTTKKFMVYFSRILQPV